MQTDLSPRAWTWLIESQISTKVAVQIANKFSSAGVPIIAIDVPHPGAIYFGGR